METLNRCWCWKIITEIKKDKPQAFKELLTFAIFLFFCNIINQKVKNPSRSCWQLIYYTDKNGAISKGGVHVHLPKSSRSSFLKARFRGATRALAVDLSQVYSYA